MFVVEVKKRKKKKADNIEFVQTVGVVVEDAGVVATYTLRRSEYRSLMFLKLKSSFSISNDNFFTEEFKNHRIEV